MLSKKNLPNILSRHINILNKRGLHARASVKFAQTTNSFNAIIKIEKNGKIVEGS